MAREARLWEWLREGLKGTEGLHMRRVENQVGAGDPDVDGCYQGRYFEIELKGCNRPKRGGPLDFEVRQAQAIWHRKRTKAGGNTWLYIRVGEGRDVRRYLVHGGLASSIRETGITEEQLAALTRLPLDHSPADVLVMVVTGARPHHL